MVHIDLYKEYIPEIDADVFSEKGKLQTGSGFEQLAAEEQSKVGRRGELSDQFVSGDKYVFVSPFWNFSFPPVFLKHTLILLLLLGKRLNIQKQVQ